MEFRYPNVVRHWIHGREIESQDRSYFDKINPADGKRLADVTAGNAADARSAVSAASKAFPAWKKTSVIVRSDILRRAALLMLEKKEEIANIVHLETGKSAKDAAGEVGGSAELGLFYAGEGRRYFGRTVGSGMPNRTAMVIREPVGICALIVPFNTPIANVCWKAFPALLCGNTAVLKASSDTPYTALWFAKVLKESGLPDGVFNVIQGRGEEAGLPIIEDGRINLVSFTGSTQTGKLIAEKTAGRFVKTSLEMGGKNPFLVCDDADLGVAADFAVSSAFSNAGQRCASASRIIVFAEVYDEFKSILLEKTRRLKIGNSNSDDLGPLINEKQLNKVLDKLDLAREKGARFLIGGKRLTGPEHKNGFYLAPTLLENAGSDSPVYDYELFAPVAAMYKVSDFIAALELANDSIYGLTSAIHTKSLARAREFIINMEAGVVSVNGPSHGSEPHMPFGGVKGSGNGHREPGSEALDVYSNIKSVYIRHDPDSV